MTHVDSTTIVRSGNAIVVKDNQTAVNCGGQPTVFNTHVIAHSDNSGGESYFTIDLRGGPFTPGQVNEPGNSDEIDIQALMGAGPDRLYIWGATRDDSWRLGRTANGVGVNLNADQEIAPGETPNVDVDLRDAEMAVLMSGPGNDRVLANGGPEFNGPLPFRADINADEGDDLIFGSSDSEFITAGPGRDEVHGGEGSDGMSSTAPRARTTSMTAARARRGRLGRFHRLGARGPARRGSPGHWRRRPRPLNCGRGCRRLRHQRRCRPDRHRRRQRTSHRRRQRPDRGPGWGRPHPAGDGTDTMSYATAPAGVRQGVTVDLDKVDLPQVTGGAGIDRLGGIENLIGSPFADRLSGSQGDNRFEIRDGSGDTLACSAGADTVVADVEGTDPIGADCETVQFDFRPDTRVEAGPPSLSRNPAPTFRFSTTKPGSTFECSLDGRPFAACDAAPALGVKDGAHILRVRARDMFGALDLSPAEHAFSVDTVAPRITRPRLSKGKKLAYRLSEAATVRVALSRGKRSRTLIREGAGGANRVALARAVRRLKPRGARYRLTLVATDRAGNSSKPVRLRRQVT